MVSNIRKPSLSEQTVQLSKRSYLSKLLAIIQIYPNWHPQVSQLFERTGFAYIKNSV